jgi:hypothetical protein
MGSPENREKRVSRFGNKNESSPRGRVRWQRIAFNGLLALELSTLPGSMPASAESSQISITILSGPLTTDLTSSP